MISEILQYNSLKMAVRINLEPTMMVTVAATTAEVAAAANRLRQLPHTVRTNPPPCITTRSLFSCQHGGKQVETYRKHAPAQVPPHWPRKSSPLPHSTLPLSMAAHSETSGNRSETSACAGFPTLAAQIQLRFHNTLSLFMPARSETAPVLVPLRWPRTSGSLLQNTLPLFLARSETIGNCSETVARTHTNEL